MSIVSIEQEQKIVALVQEIAKSIVPLNEVLEQLGIDNDEFDTIASTRAFQELLKQAQAEWSAAGNTHKRAKLKAAAVIETVLPTFYQDMVNKKEQLASRAKVLETVAKIAGLGGSDSVSSAQTGNVFRLQINYANNQPSVTLDIGANPYQDNQDNSESNNLSDNETITTSSNSLIISSLPPISSKFISDGPIDEL